MTAKANFTTILTGQGWAAKPGTSAGALALRIWTMMAILMFSGSPAEFIRSFRAGQINLTKDRASSSAASGTGVSSRSLLKQDQESSHNTVAAAAPSVILTTTATWI